MALRLIEPLTPDTPSVSLPTTVTFRAALKDTEATPETPRNHTLGLSLEDGNDLSFGGGKSVTQIAAIGRDTTPVSFTVTINGSGGNLTAFRVSLRGDTGEVLGSRLVNIL